MNQNELHYGFNHGDTRSNTSTNLDHCRRYIGCKVRYYASFYDHDKHGEVGTIVDVMHDLPEGPVLFVLLHDDGKEKGPVGRGCLHMIEV